MSEISNVLNGVKIRLVAPLKSAIVVDYTVTTVIMIMNHHSCFFVKLRIEIKTFIPLLMTTANIHFSLQFRLQYYRKYSVIH